MGTFAIDIKGQLNNIKLGTSKALWPLFEAIVNAIHSIEDSQNKDTGKIIITAIRDDEIKLPSDQPELGRINSFIIEDNGTGFNEENYASFNTAYSTLKIKKGCKGIGRFLWLKAFESVEIKSNYLADDNISIASFFSQVMESHRKTTRRIAKRKKFGLKFV